MPNSPTSDRQTFVGSAIRVLPSNETDVNVIRERMSHIYYGKLKKIKSTEITNFSVLSNFTVCNSPPAVAPEVGNDR